MLKKNFESNKKNLKYYAVEMEKQLENGTSIEKDLIAKVKELIKNALEKNKLKELDIESFEGNCGKGHLDFAIASKDYELYSLIRNALEQAYPEGVKSRYLDVKIANSYALAHKFEEDYYKSKQHKADITNINKKPSTEDIYLEAIISATENDTADGLKEIISFKGEDILKTRDSDGNSPLLMAALRGSKTVCEFLIKRDADCSIVNNKDENLLHLAALSRSKVLMRYLYSHLSNNIDLMNKKDKSGSYPIFNIIRNCDEEIVRLFLSVEFDYGQVNALGETILHALLVKGFKQLAFECLERNIFKAVIHKANKKGRTVLTIVLENKDKPLISILVAKGAEIDFKSIEFRVFYKFINDDLTFDHDSQLKTSFYHRGCELLSLSVDKSKEYLAVSARWGFEPAALLMAYVYKKEKNFFLAIKYFSQVAKSGNAEAHYELGEAYFEGLGVDFDLEKSKFHFNQAASKNHAQAILKLSSYQSKTANSNLLRNTKKRPFEESSLELFWDDKRHIKRLRIPDETDKIREAITKMREKFQGKNPKNGNLAAFGIGFIFSDKKYEKGDYSLKYCFQPFQVMRRHKTDSSQESSHYKIPEDVFKTSEIDKENAKNIAQNFKLRGENVYFKLYKHQPSKAAHPYFDFFRKSYFAGKKPLENDGHYRHSENGICYCLNNDQYLIDYLNKFCAQNPEFSPDVKVVAIVINMFSIHSLCPNCKKSITANQIDQTLFLSKLEKILEDMGYHLPQKKLDSVRKLKMVTCVLSDKNTKYKDEDKKQVSYTNIENSNIHKLNNVYIFERTQNFNLIDNKEVENKENQFTVFLTR